MRSYADQLARAKYLSVHPSADVLAGGHCQGVARDVVGAAAFGSSALNAWNTIPAAHRHPLSAAKGGMLGYAAYRDSAGRPKQYGHAFWYEGNGIIWTTDNPVMHRFQRAPLSVVTVGWHMPLLGFIDWTPSGAIPLKPTVPTVHLSHVQAAARLDPPAAQGHVTYPGEVVLVEKTLAKLGFLPAAYAGDGSFGQLTVGAYQKFQVSIQAAVRTGMPQLADLKVLGTKGGFLVAA